MARAANLAGAGASDLQARTRRRVPLLLLAAVACAVVAQGCASSEPEPQQPTSASTVAPTSILESAPTTTAVSWFSPLERQSGSPAELLGHNSSRFWADLTGLNGPTSNSAWRVRLEAACAAPIWEHAAAAELVDGFISADGGDPEAPAASPDGLSLRDDAIFVLWTMVNNGDWCAASFPPASLHVDNWLNSTGFRGPMDLAVWESRLDRACSIGEEDIDGWRLLATEFVEVDGGRRAEAARVDGAVGALQIMLRQQVRIRDDASDDSMDGTLVPIHACE